MKQENLDLIYLVGCGINDIKADIKRIEAMDIYNVYKLAVRHTLSAATFYALESCGFQPKNEEELSILKKWEELKNKAITKIIMFDSERNALFDYMDSRQIWHCALKGSILKELYPHIGMRQMADNDILFDEKFRYDVHDFFIEHGYECKEIYVSNHDVYQKLPIYNFEMHVSLFSKKHNIKLHEYFKNISDRLIKNGYEYKFSDEDFYLYILAHAYKHFSDGGTGLRTLVDFYMYNKSMGSKLDREYISKECEKLGIAKYEKVSRFLSLKLFSNPNEFNICNLTEKQQKLLAYYMYSGTYGTFENHIKNDLRKINPSEIKPSVKTKTKYVLRRAFPNKDFPESVKSTFIIGQQKREQFLQLKKAA